eukprot:4196099-Amphidinium_carterae.1
MDLYDGRWGADGFFMCSGPEARGMMRVVEGQMKYTQDPETSKESEWLFRDVNKGENICEVPLKQNNPKHNNGDFVLGDFGGELVIISWLCKFLARQECQPIQIAASTFLMV